MTDSTKGRQRGPRTDATRNRARILDEAEQEFSARGMSASLDAIAKRAGIGSGTLYRHFPNRDALLAELLAARDDELVARRDAIRRDSADGAEALDRWLEALGTWSTAFDGLPEPLRNALGEDQPSPLALTCEGFITTTDEFLQAAQEDGRARRDVRARDLFLAVLAVSWIRGAALADPSSASALGRLVRTYWARPTGTDAGEAETVST